MYIKIIVIKILIIITIIFFFLSLMFFTFRGKKNTKIEILKTSKSQNKNWNVAENK